MEQKLQSLLDKIKQEGVDKGQEVANSLINDAERKAEEIIAAAENRAEEIRKQAEQEAEELKRNVTSELKLSAEQAVSALKQRITQLVAARAVNPGTSNAFSDKDFLKGVIQSLVENWQSNGHGAALSLSPDREKELYDYFSAQAQDGLKESLTVKPNHKLSQGFRIGPKDGSYVVSFTEEDFQVFFADFLRPRTEELLYGNNQG